MRTLSLIFFLIISSNLFSQTKEDQINKILDAINFEEMTSIILNGYVSVLDTSEEIPEEVNSSIKTWIINGQEAIKDSVLIIYDQLFTEEDINELLQFYETRIGRKLNKLTPEITELTLRSSKNWGEQNQESLQSIIEPVVDEIEYKKSYAGLLDSNEIFTNLEPFEYFTPENALSSIASTNYNYSVNYNAEDWKVIDCATINPACDICFLSTNELVYSMVLPEFSNLSLQQLKAAAISNMYGRAEKIDIGNYGMIKVNDVDALNMSVEAILDGLSITYLNNYFTPPWGCMQVITFCLKEHYQTNAGLLQDINSGLNFTK